MKDLFIALSALPSQQPSMLGNGPGYDRYDPYGYGMADHGGSSTVTWISTPISTCFGTPLGTHVSFVGALSQ